MTWIWWDIFVRLVLNVVSKQCPFGGGGMGWYNCFLYFAKFFHMLLHINFCQRDLYIKNYFILFPVIKLEEWCMCHLLIHSLLNNFISSGLNFSLTTFMVNITRNLNPKFSCTSAFNYHYPLHLLACENLMPCELSKCVTVDNFKLYSQAL